MLEKLFPKTVQAVIAAIDAADSDRRREQEMKFPKEGLRGQLTRRAHNNPYDFTAKLYLSWAGFVGISSTILSWAEPISPDWDNFVFIALALLLPISLFWQYQLVPKSTMSHGIFWKTVSRYFLRSCEGKNRALILLTRAEEDLEPWDGLTGFLLHSLILASIVSACGDNDFIGAVQALDFSAIWKESYLASASIYLLIFAVPLRFIMFHGPKNWIRQIRRCVEDDAYNTAPKKRSRKRRAAN